MIGLPILNPVVLNVVITLESTEVIEVLTNPKFTFIVGGLAYPLISPFEFISSHGGNCP